MNRPLACMVIGVSGAARLPLPPPSDRVRSPPPFLLANAVLKPAADGSSQHGSARIGNERRERARCGRPLCDVAHTGRNNAGVACMAKGRPMRIATFDVSSIAAAVRRREALLRYARYLLLFNIAAAAWFVIVQFSHAASLRTWTALAPGPDWRWTALVLGAVAVTYLVLAHRLWWVYAPIVLVQVVYFFAIPSPDKQIFRVS